MVGLTVHWNEHIAAQDVLDAVHILRFGQAPKARLFRLDWRFRRGTGHEHENARREKTIKTLHGGTLAGGPASEKGPLPSHRVKSYEPLDRMNEEKP